MIVGCKGKSTLGQLGVVGVGASAAPTTIAAGAPFQVALADGGPNEIDFVPVLDGAKLLDMRFRPVNPRLIWTLTVNGSADATVDSLHLTFTPKTKNVTYTPPPPGSTLPPEFFQTPPPDVSPPPGGWPSIPPSPDLSNLQPITAPAVAEDPATTMDFSASEAGWPSVLKGGQATSVSFDFGRKELLDYYKAHTDYTEVAVTIAPVNANGHAFQNVLGLPFSISLTMRVL